MSARPNQTPDTIVLLGPTCCGKSASAIALALRLDAEIISCDSMQVYRALPIGTAQPSMAERQGIPHHLIATLELEQRWDANLFVPAAQEIIASANARGRRTIIAGGTGLYARALCYGMELLPSDHGLAMKLREESATADGCAKLLTELETYDSTIPDDIRLNPRHLARAVEVFRLTGLPPWKLRRRSETALPGFRQFCIIPDFDALKAKIAIRTKKMLADGWIEECRAAYGNGLGEAPTAWQALGYREIRKFLQGEITTLAELEQLIVYATIHYARRQLTWFRHQHPGAVMLDMAAPEQMADAITASL